MMLGTRVRLAARNTLRRRARTLFTMGMVTFSVALLLLALTWIRGVFGDMTKTGAAIAGDVRVVTQAFADREELMPLYENVPDEGAVADALRKLPGVRSVEPRIITGVTLTTGEEIGDTFAPLAGVRPSYLREQLRAHERVVEGAFFSGAEDELLVGHRVMRQLEAKVGDELVLLGTTQDGSLSSIRGRIVGVVRGANGALDSQVFAPLSRVQYLTDMPDGAVELLVYGDHFRDAPALAERLRVAPGLEALQVSAWSEREPWRSTMAMVDTTQGIIIFIFVFLSALGIWNTMMMSVLERTHEIGVMRAMGMSRLGAVGLFVGEALAVSVAGGLLGVALALYPAWLIEKVGITIGEQTSSGTSLPMPEVIHGELSLESVLMALGLGLVMALLGSLLPALRAASIQPVSAMRAGR